MLRRASVADLKAGAVSRGSAYIVITMQFYPRFIRVEQRDEFCHELAPDRELFQEFKALDRSLHDHDRAFAEVRYEHRFWPGKEGRATLARLAERSKTGDVVLVCQCRLDERCHNDLLLLYAGRVHGAPTPELTRSYPVFERRVEEWASVL